MTFLDDIGKWASDELRDFANSAIGKIALEALASSVTGALAPWLGPQLASVAFAIPGLIRGERFDTAWVSGFSGRLAKLAEILGEKASQEASQAFERATRDLVKEATARFPDEEIDAAVRRLGTEVKILAIRLGIRDDMAAEAIALTGRRSAIHEDLYDLRTGTRLPLVSLRVAVRMTTASGNDSLLTAIDGWYVQGSVAKWLRSIP